jgi:hypothetical protein
MWNFSTKNPVIVPGQLHGALDTRKAGAAHVVPIGDTYRMVYWGANESGNRILSAQAPVTSPNEWTPLGSLIEAQPNLTYNAVGPGFPFLLPVSEQRWLLYFCGWGRLGGRRLPNTTGVAISDDGGQNWRYHDSNPILPLDRPYDREGTGSVWVLHEAGKFRMYYTAIGRYFDKPDGVLSGHGNTIPEIGVAYAESDDGLHWHKPFDDWVVRPRHFDVEPYEYICSKPCVVAEAEGGPYVMWVNTFGSAYRVHRLTSCDGIHWEWSPRVGPEGELGIGGAGAFDSVQRSYPTMVAHNGGYRCWYTGNDFGRTGMGYAESTSTQARELMLRS